MKIALFTLCKNRLKYTKQTLKSLQKKTTISYDHFILDQNSKDETFKFLKNFTNKLGNMNIYSLTKNIGINRGVNFLIERIGNRYDVVVKIDNDVQIETKGWLKKCITSMNKKMLISPYVKGLIDNRGGVNRYKYIKERNIGLTPFIGGICMIGYINAWNKDSGGWTFPVPKHAGGDKDFCIKLSLKGYRFGYKEDVIIKHIETTSGQHERYPIYFKQRKQERRRIF